jgi:hypothetical protein
MLRNLLLLLSLGACAAGAAQLTLTTNGKSSYTICVSPQASPSERAANELQRFLKEMSGAELPVVSGDPASTARLIFVGDSPALQRLKPGIDFAHLGPEGFALKIIGRHLVIAGGGASAAQCTASTRSSRNWAAAGRHGILAAEAQSKK